MYQLFPDKDVQCTRINIPCRNNRRQMPALAFNKHFEYAMEHYFADNDEGH